MESSLADTYRDIIGSVGFDLGWGRGADNGDEAWSAQKEKTLKEVVKGGLQQFYNPPPDQTGVSHQWSFLKPLASLTLDEGTKTVMLPPDFKGMESEIIVVSDQGGWPSVKVGGRVRALLAAYPEASGRPQEAEIEPLKDTSKERGQRFQLAVYPEADQDYTLQFKYSIQGRMLSGELPYAYGGAEHSSTIVASCLAWAELHLDDIPQGPKYGFWRERLAASISMDRQKLPQTLGLNLDRSDRQELGKTGRRHYPTGFSPISYAGVVWE